MWAYDLVESLQEPMRYFREVNVQDVTDFFRSRKNDSCVAFTVYEITRNEEIAFQRAGVGVVLS